MIATLLAFVAVFAQLVKLQKLDEAGLVETEAARVQRERSVPAARGKFFDRDMTELALSLDRSTISLDPRLVGNATEYSEVLAPYLGDTPEQIRAKIVDAQAQGRAFIYLGRQLDLDDAAAIADLGLIGVSIESEPARFYPFGEEFAAPILGGVDIDHLGSSGLEVQYEDLLRGVSGRVEYEGSPYGEIPGTKSSVAPAVPGKDLVLTIDSNLQWLTQSLVGSAVRESDAAWGAAVVLKTDTGEILSMASMKRDTDGVVRPSSYNLPMVDIYEPGSVAKMFTIAGAIDAGLVNPSTVVKVEDEMEVYDVTFVEHGGEKSLTVSDVLRTSSNLGTIGIAEMLGKRRLYDTFTDFGLGRRTGPGGTAQFPGESAGILADPTKWNGVSLATIAFGQGVSTTVLQVAAGYNVIANDGVYIAPSLVRSTIDWEGKHESVAAPESRRVVSEQTATLVSEMLEGVVHNEGTGVLAAVAGYRVAGKTGTAEVPDLELGGYREEVYIATFAGFAPARDPEVTIVVVIAEPVGEYYASKVAAPLFSDLAARALRTLRVPPTEVVG